jgi:hypothetical protein
MYDLRLADCAMVLCRCTVAAIDKAARFSEGLGSLTVRDTVQREPLRQQLAFF